MNIPLFVCFQYNKILQFEESMNLNWETNLPQIEGYQKYSPVCWIFVQWNPAIWGINISVWRKVVRIKMQNSLCREWWDFKAKHTFFNLPQFVAFIIHNILQSEECEVEWNFKYSSDWWKWKKIPHSVGLLVQIDRTIWGIWI